MSDAAQCRAQNLETPIADLVPLLRKNRNVMLDIADPPGNIGSFRMNHLYPPFNDVQARRAILMAMSQEDCMRALVGDDDAPWKPLPGFFTPGTPLYNEEGGEILSKVRAIYGCWRKAAMRVRLPVSWRRICRSSRPGAK
jgi:peptide/nickel transport system substrate-binding protein